MLSLYNLLYLFSTHSTHFFKQQNHLFMCVTNLHFICTSFFFLSSCYQKYNASNDLDSIDIYDAENLKDINSIYIGFMTKQFAWKNDLIGTARYREFLSEAIKFFQQYVTYLRKAIPVLKDDVIKCLTFILVPALQKARPDELGILVTRFPNVIPQENITQLETEFLECQSTSDKELTSYLNESKTTNTMDFIWNEIAKINDLCTGQPKFKHLPTLVKFLLLIPHSNVYYESIFSTVKKICTDDRHNLSKDVAKGHTCTSVYQSTTGIGNNLLSLLITKVNIFLK